MGDDKIKAYVKTQSSRGFHELGSDTWTHAWKNLGPLAAALLNSTFVQAFELDDYHSEAPLHSTPSCSPPFSPRRSIKPKVKRPRGPHRLVGRRSFSPSLSDTKSAHASVKGLHGGHIISLFGRSGAVFGPSPAAGSVSKLLGLRPNTVEDALSIACIQVCD